MNVGDGGVHMGLGMVVCTWSWGWWCAHGVGDGVHMG